MKLLLGILKIQENTLKSTVKSLLNYPKIFCSSNTNRVKWDEFVKKLSHKENEVNKGDIINGLRYLRRSSIALYTVNSELEKISTKVTSLISSLCSNEIVQILSCFAQLDFLNPNLIEKLCFSLSKEKKLRHEDYSKLFYSIGRLQKVCNKSIKYDYEHLGFSDSYQYCYHPIFADQNEILKYFTLSMNLTKSFYKYSRFEITNIIYGIGQICPGNHKYYKNLVDQLAAKIVEDKNTLSSYTPTSLSIVLYSLGQLNIKNDYIIKSIIDHIKETHNFNEFPLEGLSTIIYGLGKIEWKADSFVKGLLCEIAKEERISRISAWDLTSILYGLSKMRYIDKISALDTIIQEISRTRRLASFTEQGITMILYCLSIIDIRNINAFRIVLDEIFKSDRLNELTYKGICMVLRSIDKISKEYYYHKFAEERIILDKFLIDKIIHRIYGNKSEIKEKDIVSFIYGIQVLSCHNINYELKKKLIEDCVLNITKNKFYYDNISDFELSVLANSISVESLFNVDNIWETLLLYLKNKSNFESMSAQSLSVLFCALSKHFVKSRDKEFFLLIKSMFGELISKQKSELLSESLIINIFNGMTNILNNKEFKDIVDFKGLSFLYTSIGENTILKSFSTHNIVGLVSNIIQMPSIYFSHNFCDLLIAEMSKGERLKNISGSSIAHFFYYSSKTKKTYNPINKLLIELTIKDPRLIKDLECNYLSMMIQAIGIMKITDKKLLDIILSECIKQNRIEEYSGKNLSLIFHGLSKLNVKNMTLLHILTEELVKNRRKILDLNFDLVSILFYSLAVLHYKNTECINLIIERLKQIKNDEIPLVGAINSLSALSKFQIEDNILVDKLIYVILEYNKNSILNSKCHASLFYSMGRLKIYDKRAIIYLESLILRKSSDFNSDVLTSVIYAVSQIGLKSEKISNEIISSLCFLDNLNSINDLHYRNILAHLHTLIFNKATIHLIPKFIFQLRKKILNGTLGSENYSSLIIGLAKLLEKYKNIPSAYILLSSLLSRELLRKMNLDQLVTAIYAACHAPNIGVYLVMDCIAVLIQRGLNLCSNKQLIRMIETICICKTQSNNQLKIILREALQPKRLHNYSVEDFELLKKCMIN